MADSASDPPERSAADKERSRQLSRSVSGKEAARNVGGGNRSQGRQRGQGQGRGQAQGAQRQGQGAQRQGQRSNGQRADGQQDRRPQSGRRPAQRQAARPGARRPPARRPGRGGRSRTGLFVWVAIGLVIVIVGVIVGVSQTTSTTPTSGVHYTPKPVPATVLDEITHVPAASYDAVGTGITGANHAPTVDSSQKLLTSGGKPLVFGLFGEFCPYCAAERWAIITSLSRFGTFSGLKTMQSSPVDSYPKTQTFEFDTATYTSPYIATKLVEFYGQDNAQGVHLPINTLTKAEADLAVKYDGGTAAKEEYSIPFSDWGNKVLFTSSSYTPQVLQGLSRATIAAGLKHPTNPVTKLILGTANYMSAAVCYIDGGKPGSVCASSGVQAAAKALKIKV